MKLKILKILLFLVIFAFLPQIAFAKTESFVSIVNPVRGKEFWQLNNQTPKTAVVGQIEILKKFNLKATWLVRFDALTDSEIVNLLKENPGEKGLFLEVIPSWAKEADVSYKNKPNWHDAEVAFLSGYERGDREKLIDKSFEKFKDKFGYIPKSVGAWWIDSYSLSYMEKKYGITSALIVADQYTTDNYQIWGQYFSTPYYPAKNNALHPASSKEDKLPIVITQWAARDPVNGYGDGVLQSTFSVQANDYMDYHNLDTKYFSKLVDIYTSSQFNRFSQLVVGLENSYSWDKYSSEYSNQIKVLSEKQQTGQFKVVTLDEFAWWYKTKFPDLSPEHIIIADDPLGSYKKTIWFMNPYYRAGWFLNSDGSIFRDIRQYLSGEEELCFQKKCSAVNFATFATRVLDEVSFGQKLVIDEGKIHDFKITKDNENYILSYSNEAGNKRTVIFLPRDIGIDGKISSIDTFILSANHKDTNKNKTQINFEKGPFKWSAINFLTKSAKFILFIILAVLIPGLILSRKILDNGSIFLNFFLSSVVGFVSLTLLFYLFSLLHIRLLIYIYLLISLIFFTRLRLYRLEFKFSINKQNFFIILLILAGILFQVIPTFRNGLLYPFGLGFWGPNTHDGIWHVSLINQLTYSVPPENPVFAGQILKNYHYLYDLLIATTVFLSNIPVTDLVFRFYPVTFSLLLGIGTFYLAYKLFSSKLAAGFALYFTYFAGSFGWIVSYIKDKTLAGESAFWANQSVSFNLNPPFAISLLIVVALLIFLVNINRKSLFLIILLAGSLIGFKAYGAALILASLMLVGILRRKVWYIFSFIGGAIISLLLFFANFTSSSQLFIFSPFWLIHSMVDSPDRIGWQRLSLARQSGLENGNIFKFISSEIISLVLFIAGNLGIRVIGLLIFTRTGKIFKNDIFLFIFSFSVLSFLIPILFIQSGIPWNTIQFIYYGLYIVGLFAAAVLGQLVFKLPKAISLTLVILVLIITPVNSIATATYYTNYLPHGRIEPKEVEALQFLKNQQQGIVLTFPYDKKTKQKISEPWPLFAYDSTAYVSALSNKSVYLEDEPQNDILLTDYKKRLVASKDFFYRVNGEKFLKENNIKYVYLPKIYNLTLDTNSLNLKTIFENETVLIYKVQP